MPKFTHLIEECGSRGGLPIDLATQAREPILEYFKNGDPVSVQLFTGYMSPPRPFVVTYSKKEFLEALLNDGLIRICHRSYYRAPTHLESIRDDETSRHFFIPTFRERMEGKSS